MKIDFIQRGKEDDPDTDVEFGVFELPTPPRIGETVHMYKDDMVTMVGTVTSVIWEIDLSPQAIVYFRKS